jgi:hypothetical protein
MVRASPSIQHITFFWFLYFSGPPEDKAEYARSATGRRVSPLLSGFATGKKKRYIEGTCKMQVIYSARKRTTIYRRKG